MKIRTEHQYFQWVAYDDETYDGAPDAGRARTIGTGDTEAEAIEDLKEQLELAQ